MDLGNASLLPMWSDLSQNVFVSTCTTNTQWHLGNPYSLILPGDCWFLRLFVSALIAYGLCVYLHIHLV